MNDVKGSLKKKSILLTGGSGFIGRNILESKISEKYDVVSPSSKDLNLLDDRFVDEYFSENRFDYVIHSACMPGHRAAGNAGKIFYSNTRMFFNLERQKDRYEKMLVIGSGAIYDNRNYRPKVKEEDYLEFLPEDEHGFSKYVCEKAIENSQNIIDLRVFGVFGKYEEYRIRFISNLICKALLGMDLSMNQDRSFDFLYVDDLIEVIEILLANPNQFKAYNITPNKSERLSVIANYIREKIDPNLKLRCKQEGFGSEYSGSNLRFKAEFPSWEPAKLTDSIDDLIAWYEKNLASISRQSLIEIDG